MSLDALAGVFFLMATVLFWAVDETTAANKAIIQTTPIDLGKLDPMISIRLSLTSATLERLWVVLKALSFVFALAAATMPIIQRMDMIHEWAERLDAHEKARKEAKLKAQASLNG